MAGPALAQLPPKAEELQLHAVTLKHQPAVDGMQLIQGLLSPRGAVELQPGSNTLVIRDTGQALARILPVLRSYDHQPRPIKVEVFVVKASRGAPVSPQVLRSDLPEELTRHLRELLPYDIYEMQAQAQLSTQEGQAVTYDLGEGYQISFRLGTLMDQGRVRLSDFQVARRTGESNAARRLIHTNLNLVLDHPMNLGFARSESSREALMVVLTVRRGDPATIAGARPPRGEP